jgi:outer membrane lipoprotein-sorting protein
MVRRFLAGIALLALLAPIASAQTADELVTKNIAAKGGLEKLKAISSSRATGRMVAGPGMEFPFTMVNKRPNSTRIEFNVQGMTGIQAYDGKTAWMSMPFMGKKDPEPMAADEAKMFEEQADFDGPLVDYKAKGHAVELVGKEQVEGADAYKLKLTLKNGDVRYVYLDAETFLEIKMEAKRTIRGTEVEGESYLGDYKEVGGIMMAHAMESGAKGSAQRQKLIIDKVEMNVDVADDVFAMPAASAKADSASATAKGATSATKDAGKTAVKAADATGKTAVKTVEAAKADSAKAGKKKP